MMENEKSFKLTSELSDLPNGTLQPPRKNATTQPQKEQHNEDKIQPDEAWKYVQIF